MQQVNFDEGLEEVLVKDLRYHRDAYHFVREALDHTPRGAGKSKTGEDRHVTAQELLEGIRQFALKRYGPMTISLLDDWGVRCCGDFGEIVFNMVESKLLHKTDKDRREDFQAGYDFQAAFVHPYLPTAKLPKIAPTPLAEKETP